MKASRALMAQARADLLVYLRSPAALFFSVLLPVLFLLLFVAIFGNQTDDDGVKIATYQVPGFVTLAIASASFVGVAISLVRTREAGVLKRMRGTPVPTWVVFGGRIGVSIVTGFVVTVVLVLLGLMVFGVKLRVEAVPALLVTLVLGSATLCALAVAFSRAIGSEDAAAAMTNFVVLPLYFISGVFVPTTQLPDWLNRVADAFPIKALNQSLFAAFDPNGPASGFKWSSLAVLVIWGVGGLLLAALTFRWVPRREAE